MTREDAITELRGRVRALLTAVDQASSGRRASGFGPLEVYPNSRIYKELREALYLVECPQAARDAIESAKEPTP